MSARRHSGRYRDTRANARLDDLFWYHDDRKATRPEPMTGKRDPIAKVVAIDDDSQSLELIRETLADEPLQILTATDPRQGLDLVVKHAPEIVLLDLVIPEVSGMELLVRILDAVPTADVLLITGHYSPESAVEAIQKGASDYLTKPISVVQLRQRVGALVEQARRRQQAVRLDRELAEISEFEGMVGRSPLMLEVFARIRRIAPHFRTVLVTGATGTGKELAARALHRLSPAASGRFVVCNASAVVETLFESELFGHVKGAFTGATTDKMGLFEYADAGCLLLDEVGDMPLATQAKLLRVLQQQEVQRVGALVSRKVDVRVIAATNRDLAGMIKEQKFREDLYYRLAMVEIGLPRLAERGEDLPLLAHGFIEKFAAQYNKPLRGLTPRAQVVLARYHWPGNVRELENVLGNACMMAESELVDVRDLPQQLRSAAAHEMTDDGELLPMAEVELRHALRVLDSVGGNKLRAAKILGINRATLYRLLQQTEGSKRRTANRAATSSPTS